MQTMVADWPVHSYLVSKTVGPSRSRRAGWLDKKSYPLAKEVYKIDRGRLWISRARPRSRSQTSIHIPCGENDGEEK